MCALLGNKVAPPFAFLVARPSLTVFSLFYLLSLQLIKDYKLFMVVGILVFIDVAILTTMQIVDPLVRGRKLMKPEVSVETNNDKHF